MNFFSVASAKTRGRRPALGPLDDEGVCGVDGLAPCGPDKGGALVRPLGVNDRRHCALVVAIEQNLESTKLHSFSPVLLFCSLDE